MSKLTILQLESSTWNVQDIALRTPSKLVLKEDLASEWFRSFVIDLFETLYSDTSGVGLAAPQVGILLQVIVIDIKKDCKRPLLLINPSYKAMDSEISQSTECCLSVPLFSGEVMRYKKITVHYMDINGNDVYRECNGFESIVMQHEIDHLNGVLYIDKIVEGMEPHASESYMNGMAKKSLENILKSE